MIRKWLGLVVVSLFLLLLIACSSSTNQVNTNEDESERMDDTPAVQDEKISLRLGTWDGGNGLELITEITEAYMADNPNIVISVEPSPDQYTTKLLTQIAGGDAPDIFQMGDADVRMFAERGATVDLTDFIESDPSFNEDDYYETILDVGRVDGSLHALPKDWSNLAVYYNKRLFDEAGIPHPQPGWTWEEFYDIAKRLTVEEDGKIVQWGAQMGGSWKRSVLPIIHAHGGSLISPDGTTFDGYMNSDGTLQALELYRDMYFGDTVLPSNTDTESFQGIDLFGTERVAMRQHGRWSVRPYDETPNLDYGTVTLPVGPNGPANTICYAGYGIYSGSDKKEAAWDFLKYIGGAPGARVMADHAFSAVISVSEEVGHADDPIFKGFLDDVPHIKELPAGLNHHFTATGAQEFTKVLEKLMMPDPVDIKKELDDAATNSQSLLDREMAQE